MKKIYAFLAAALMSISVFAAKDVVPSDAVLADYYNQGDVCVCFFVPANMGCNDIVLTGSFNGWKSTAAECLAVEAVEGYDGWYVCSFPAEAEPDAERGMQAIPVMLDVDGNFNWSYRVGAATAIRGGVQVVQGSYAGEVDLINYGADAPNVFTVDAWMQNPCTVIYHNYIITVINDGNDGCNGLTIPFIVGGMTSWEFKQMQLDMAKTQEYQTAVYYYNFKAAEGTPYQIVSAGMDPMTGQVDPTAQAGWTDDAYMQMYVDDQWKRIPGDEGDNQLTHENANIVWNLRVDTLRWARCAPAEPEEYTVMWVKLPTANCPEAVEIIGPFDDWRGTAMELLESGWHFVELEAKASQCFKFREAGDWEHELEVYNAETDEWAKVADNQFVFGQLWQDDSYKGTPCKWIELDMSNPNLYRWSGEFKYNLTVTCDNAKGRVTGSGQYNSDTQVTFSAIPNSGYHFVQWNDSVTDNPRTLQLTQDTTFTAFFEIDSFYVSISCDTTKGSVDTINGFYPYGAQLNINATPKYGYHFDRWSDNRYSNPRSLTITSNTYLTAIFAKNSYYVHGITNPNQGTISGTGSFLYEDYCTIQAVPNYGYHFVQWSDSVIENPRSFVLTQDTMFAAEFAVDTMGTCGKNDALNWVYDAGTKTLVISGDGSFDEHMHYGVQAKSNMSQLIIQEGVTAIGESAFAGSEALTTLSLPTSLKRIGDYAFQNCLDLSVIYNHRATPCVISTNTFDGINIFDCTLLVPAGSLAMYKHEASNWHIFYFIDTFGEDSTSLYIVNYLDKDSINIGNEIVKLHLPQAPEIEGFTFLGWRPVPSIIVDGIVVQAIYQSNTQGNAPAEVINPYNPVQKLVRNGNVYILTDDNTYTIDGRLVH